MCPSKHRGEVQIGSELCCMGSHTGCGPLRSGGSAVLEGSVHKAPLSVSHFFPQQNTHAWCTTCLAREFCRGTLVSIASTTPPLEQWTVPLWQPERSLFVRCAVVCWDQLLGCNACHIQYESSATSCSFMCEIFFQNWNQARPTLCVTICCSANSCTSVQVSGSQSHLEPVFGSGLRLKLELQDTGSRNITQHGSTRLCKD